MSVRTLLLDLLGRVAKWCLILGSAIVAAQLLDWSGLVS